LDKFYTANIGAVLKGTVGTGTHPVYAKVSQHTTITRQGAVIFTFFEKMQRYYGGNGCTILNVKELH
jgi:hypothetical protein